MKNPSSHSAEVKHFKSLSQITPYLVVLTCMFLLGIYFYNFNGDFGNQAQFGAFGDFLGGVLNPILSFLTILLLIYSLRFQIEELTYTRHEVERTNEIHKDNVQQQRLLFDMNRYISELDLLKNRIDYIFQKDVIEVRFVINPFSDGGPAAKYGIDYKYEKFSLYEMCNRYKCYKNYHEHSTFDNVANSIKEIDQLTAHFKPLVKALEVKKFDPLLYQMTSESIEQDIQHIEHLKNVLDEI